MMRLPEITAEELRRALEAGSGPFLLDVREPYEAAAATLGGRLIPLRDLPRRASELDPSREIVVYCHSGLRSARAVEFLIQSGFPRVCNLAGGIVAWVERVGELPVKD